MSTSSDTAPESRGGSRTGEPLSRIVDWLTAAFLVLGGLLAATVGAGLYTLADRDWIADRVADGTITSPELTDAELVDVTYALLTWGGLGLAVVGLLLIGSGVAFLVYRTRERRRTAMRTGGPDRVTLAIVGGVVTIVTSFVPFSPILGGLVAGYLRGGDGRDGAGIGAFAGLVAAIPLVLLGLFLLGGLWIAAAELGLGGGVAIVATLALVFGLLVSVAFVVGLSALGGYIGVSVGERNREPRPDAAS